MKPFRLSGDLPNDLQAAYDYYFARSPDSADRFVAAYWRREIGLSHNRFCAGCGLTAGAWRWFDASRDMHFSTRKRSRSGSSPVLFPRLAIRTTRWPGS